MNTVACVSPFVPPEWIAAHGWQPRWLALDPARGRPGGMTPALTARMRTHRARVLRWSATKFRIDVRARSSLDSVVR